MHCHKENLTNLSNRKGERGIGEKLHRLINIWKERHILPPPVMTAISTRLSNGGHSKPQASASSAPSAAAGAVQPIEIEKLVGALTAEGREGALDIAAGLRVNATVGVMDDLPAMQQAAQTGLLLCLEGVLCVAVLFVIRVV